MDRIVSLSVSLHKSSFVIPRLSIDDRTIMSKMVSKLLHYLRPKFSTYHVRAVNLIWSLESSVKRPYVESILAQSLTSPESRNDIGAYEAFGVLWRLTGTCSTSKEWQFFLISYADFRGQSVAGVQIQSSTNDCPRCSEERRSPFEEDWRDMDEV